MRGRLVLIGAGASLLLLAGPAPATMPASEDPAVAPSAPSAPELTAPRSVSVGTAREAWYQLTGVKTCSSPAGCLPVERPGLPELPVAPTVYPPDTLHVGWAGGAELARTYLKLDRARLPQGATLVSGTLTLPLVSDPAAGTVLADSAGIKACLASTSFSDGVAGSLAAAPAMDCSVSSPLALDGSAFRVDLQPFIEAWASGTEDHGVALTPFTSSSVQSAWAIALPGRNATGVPHIEAALEYVVAQGAVPPAVVAPAQPAVRAPQLGANPPVQAPGLVGKSVQAPPAGAPAQQDQVTAAGPAPFGWAVLALALVALLAIPSVTRPGQVPAR